MQDRTLQGVILVSAAVFAMAFGDAIAKQLSGSMSIWQIFFTRSLFAIPVLIFVVRIAKIKVVVHAPKWVFIRSILIVLTWIVYYASFPVLSLSVAAVAIYTFPIMVALFSTLLIGEPATKRQWAGICLGFVGVMVILKPGTDAFSWFTLLPILGAVFLALAMILTRKKCQPESPLILSLSLLTAFLIVSSVVIVALLLWPLPASYQESYPFLFVGWGQMGQREWLLMVFIGVISIGIFAGIARAYQNAPPSIVATFDYVYLVSATIWGFVFFAEKPGFGTLSGMAMIIFAGIMVAFPSSKKV